MTIRSLGRAFSRLVLVLGAAWAFPAWAVNDLAGGPKVNQLDLHPPVTAIASDMQWLHNFMLIICLVIFVGVFGVMFYSIIKHRKSKGARAANFHESTTAVSYTHLTLPTILLV